MVFGDNYNDMEMLEMAGMPIAMERAVPELKAVSRRQTDRVERVLEEVLAGCNLLQGGRAAAPGAEDPQAESFIHRRKRRYV